MDSWAVNPASKSDRGRFGWQERQPNRPLSDSLAQNFIESARPVCSPAGHAVRSGRTRGSIGEQTVQNIYEINKSRSCLDIK